MYVFSTGMILTLKLALTRNLTVHVDNAQAFQAESCGFESHCGQEIVML